MKKLGLWLVVSGAVLAGALPMLGAAGWRLPSPDVCELLAILVALVGFFLYTSALSAEHPWRRASLRVLPLVGATVALLLVFRFFVTGFLELDNMVDLAQQISVNAIMAFGMTLVILIGGIDLSVGALVALVGTTAVYLLTRTPTDEQHAWWTIVSMLAGLSVAGAFGAFHGTLAARTRMPPFIITLGTMLIVRGAARRFNLGRPMHIPDHETLLLGLGNVRLFRGWDVPAILQIPVPVLVMGVLFLLAAILLHRTRFGQHLYAIGGNREAARFTGIPIVRIEILVYMLCSLLTGLAGLIHTSQLYSAEPASGVNFELDAIAAAVVGGTSFTGGKGTMYGTLLGAIVIGILNKGLNQTEVDFSWQLILKGAVILTAVFFDVRRRGQ